MFGNFIYFIVALLIYSTYQPVEKSNFPPLETLGLFCCLNIVFTYFSWRQFHRLQKNISTENFSRLDHKFNSILTRQSVMAIALFAIDIYGLNLTSFSEKISLFSTIPTFQALIFLGIFTGYLAIVWVFAHGSYQKLYMTGLSRRSYVLSNISFSLPVVLPWLLLSVCSDIIYALPYELPKRFLSTSQGQAIYFFVFLFGVAVLGPAMIQKFWRCRPLEVGVSRLRIENMCARAGLEYKNILYWPLFGGRMITAGVMGLVKKFRYILVTDALLRLLEPEEMDAVIAHEIGHVKRKHLVFYLIFFVGYLLFFYTTSDLIFLAIVYAEPVYRFADNTRFNPVTVTSGVFSLVQIVNFLIYFRFILGFFMRNFERQADIYVYSFSDSAGSLISTLEKIAATSGQSPDRPNWHHFSITERIAYLKKCESDKTWITRHDRKIRKSIAAYLVAMLLVGGVGYHLSYGKAGKKLNDHFLEKIIQRELEKTPENPNLYSFLGNLYYSRNDYEGAVAAYEKAIGLAPNNPEVLNNLAWLYATCEDEKLRDPEKAVILAQKAAALEASPHILDTLAESYYVNGRYAEAVSAAKRALDSAKKNRSYFEEQLKKFTEAAEQKASGGSL